MNPTTSKRMNLELSDNREESDNEQAYELRVVG
jgi:hypothetical protein